MKFSSWRSWFIWNKSNSVIFVKWKYVVDGVNVVETRHKWNCVVQGVYVVDAVKLHNMKFSSWWS